MENHFSFSSSSGSSKIFTYTIETSSFNVDKLLDSTHRNPELLEGLFVKYNYFHARSEDNTLSRIRIFSFLFYVLNYVSHFVPNI